MLRAFRSIREGAHHHGLLDYASGIMAWSNSGCYIPVRDFRREDKGDQLAIAAEMVAMERDIVPVQSVLKVASYKWHGKVPELSVYEDTDVLCYHGQPRPHETDWDIPQAIKISTEETL